MMANEESSEVVRAFRLSDLLRLYRLRRQGLQMDMESALTQPRAPLWAAITGLAMLPWQDMGTITYVAEGRDESDVSHVSVLQLQKRSGRPEAALMFVTPCPQGLAARQVLRHVLNVACEDAREHKVQRVYATLPDEPDLLEAFQAVSFSLYTRETVYRLAEPPPRRYRPGWSHIRPQKESDQWGLQRVYALHTPKPVQQAEGATGGNGARPPMAPWTDLEASCFVIEEAQELVAAGQLITGYYGHLIRVWGDIGDSYRMEALLYRLLFEAASYSPRPVFIGARDYHGGLRPLLEDMGFHHFADCARLVRYLVQFTREAVPRQSAALEHSAVPPMTGSMSQSHHNGNRRSRDIPVPVYSQEENQANGHGCSCSVPNRV